MDFGGGTHHLIALIKHNGALKIFCMSDIKLPGLERPDVCLHPFVNKQVIPAIFQFNRIFFQI